MNSQKEVEVARFGHFVAVPCLHCMLNCWFISSHLVDFISKFDNVSNFWIKCFWGNAYISIFLL